VGKSFKIQRWAITIGFFLFFFIGFSQKAKSTKIENPTVRFERDNEAISIELWFKYINLENFSDFDESYMPKIKFSSKSNIEGNTFYVLNNLKEINFKNNKLIWIKDNLKEKRNSLEKIFSYQSSDYSQNENSGGFEINPTVAQIFSIIFSAKNPVITSNIIIKNNLIEIQFDSNKGNISSISIEVQNRENIALKSVFDVLPLLVKNIIYQLKE